MMRLHEVEDNILTIDVSGQIDTEEMASALDAYIAKAETLQNAGLLLRYKDVKMPTLGAVAAEMSRFIPLLGTLDNFKRIALVANQDWVRTTARIQEALIPGIEMRVFEPGEEDEARAFLMRDPLDDLPV